MPTYHYAQTPPSPSTPYTMPTGLTATKSPRHSAYFPTKHVGFSSSLVSSICRPASNDELGCFYPFELHASQCRECGNPLAVHSAGRSLCGEGATLARTVFATAYSREDGSLVFAHALEHGKKVRLEVPKEYRRTLALLRAREKGLSTRRHVAVLQQSQRPTLQRSNTTGHTHHHSHHHTGYDTERRHRHQTPVVVHHHTHAHSRPASPERAEVVTHRSRRDGSERQSAHYAAPRERSQSRPRRDEVHHRGHRQTVYPAAGAYGLDRRRPPPSAWRS